MMPAVESYLAARRAAGFKLSNAEYLLRSFARFAVNRGEMHVRAQTAIDWAAEAASVAQRDARLRTVCRFARYLSIEDQNHELPPVRYFACRKTRRTPYIYTRTDIERLIDAALKLGPSNALQPHTYAALIALLSATGLRVSEALNLRFADITPDALVIRKSKFQKSRLVPLHDTATKGLHKYLTLRRLAHPDDDHAFVDDDGHPLRYTIVYWMFRKLLKFAGIGPQPTAAALVCMSSGIRSPFVHSRRALRGGTASGSTCWPSRRTWGTLTSMPPTGISRPLRSSCVI
ncbi:tyrosine-type recombinase/integrase [Trinickia mobilis]|uniref:tyrosine-type recombinase/integrase n=1 Tax=Trinickia mobilis TaxID=2816356 RepID=UPI001A90B7D3|nr:tyrosine-type recombinase/integrase [Trinickia mobilis]